jgi:hypothetical protein
MNKTISTVKANPIGAIAGMGAGYYAVKKYMPASSMPILLIGVIIGGIAGANVSAMIKARQSTPTRAQIKN